MINAHVPQHKGLIWQFPIAIAFIIIAIFIAGMIDFTRKRLRLEEDLLLTATAMDHAVEQELSSVKSFTQALSATLESELLSRNFSLAQEKSAHALAASHIADHVVLTEDSGQQLFNTLIDYGQPLPITNNIYRIHEVFKSGKPYISNLAVGTISKNHEIIVDIPVFYNGKVIYALTSVLNSDALRGILLDQHFSDEWVATIFDRNGVVVSRSSEQESYVGKTVTERLLDQLANQGSGVYENVNFDGVTAVAAFVRSGISGFGVTIAVPKKILLGESLGSLPATAISISVAVFALLAAWHFANDLKIRRETETQLKQFIKHAPVALAMFDRNMNYMAASQRWTDDNRLGDGEFVGLLPNSAMSGMPEQWKDAHRRGLDGEITHADEDLIREGQWLRWEARPWKTAGGTPGGIVIFYEEITERKMAEAKVQELNAVLEQKVEERTAELTAANIELESFAYTVSHDLRAPLRAMSGFSQALVEDLADHLEGDARTYLSEIADAGQHMSELVDGILTLSRSTRGELLRERIDFSALTEIVRKELEMNEPDRKVAWSVERGITGWGDRRMIEMVFRNLLGNAWKFTAKTSEPIIRVHLESHDGERFVCVSDNGAGFDQRHIDRLFKPFQRMHRTDEFPGIGIGLSTVCRIIQRHGGKILAEGAVGKGATFKFFLPENGERGGHGDNG
jgi:PAS domain S-box-containing protein